MPSDEPFEPADETGPMEVVRVLPHGEVLLLGHCDRFNVRPGDTVRVREPTPLLDWSYWLDPQVMVRAGLFTAIPVTDMWQRWTAIEVTDTSPPVEWLPGWRPVGTPFVDCADGE